MEFKSETSALIKEFIETIKSNLKKKSEVIRWDRRGEFLNKELQSYLRTEEVQMQQTKAYSL